MSGVLLTSLLLSAAVTVTVTSSRHSTAIADRLSEELGEARIVEDGDIVVEIEDDDGALVLTVTDADVLLRRRIGLEDGLTPALRLAALLVVEVVDRLDAARPVTQTATAASSAPPPDRPPPPAIFDPPPAPPATTATTTPITSNPTFWVSGGVTIGWWSVPAAPRVGIAAGATYDIGAWGLAGQAGAEGLCCTFTEPGRVEGRSVRLWTLVDVTYRFLVVDGFWVGPTAGIGLEAERGQSLAIAFAGDPVAEPLRGFGAEFRGGAHARIRVGSRWFVAIAGGLKVRTIRVISRLPPPFSRPDPDVDGGRILPWGVTSVGFGFF